MTSQFTLNKYGPRKGLTPRIREEILQNPCAYCGYYVVGEVDHIIPYSRGGSNELENLCATCRRCNADKSDLTPEEWRDWRESNGRSWPPPNLEDFIAAMSKGSTKGREAELHQDPYDPWTEEQDEAVYEIICTRFDLYYRGRFEITPESILEMREAIVRVVAPDAPAWPVEDSGPHA